MTTPHKLTPWLPVLFVPLYLFVLLHHHINIVESADTMGNYSADGMEFSNNTYTNNPKINQHTTTNHHRGNRNSQLLKTNTQGFTDVVKRDGGNVDYSSSTFYIPGLEIAEAIGAKDPSEKSMNDAMDVIEDGYTDAAKTIDDYTLGAGQMYQDLKEGKYGTLLVGAMVSRIPAGNKVAQTVKKLLKGKKSGTVTRIGDKVYTIDGKGHAFEVKRKRGTPPPNLSPNGAGRKGAFRQAKRDAGIPVSQQPLKVTIVKDSQSGKPIKVYTFKNKNGKNIEIRDDKYGHHYGKGNLQNRSSHFNAGNAGGKLKDHYDY